MPRGMSFILYRSFPARTIPGGLPEAFPGVVTPVNQTPDFWPHFPILSTSPQHPIPRLDV